MALTLIKKPEGATVSTTTVTASASSGASGLLVHKVGHGLSDNDVVYVKSNVYDYCGFWFVVTSGADDFYLADYNQLLYVSSYVQYISTPTTITYNTTSTCILSSIHLPIVYKLKSDLWPINSVDTARTVSSYSNDFGYCKLTLSGNLTSTVTELEFVKVTFTGGTTGIYQILTWYSNSVVTINLAYAGGITFTSVQYYYNNYHAKVRIYSGRVSSSYTTQYPQTLLCEIKVIPDSSGIITVNVNEHLKSGINPLANNLLLATLPNNVDAWTSINISYAEGYDYSVGGYTLLDYIGSYSDLNLTTHYAINASLPFKNVQSGFMGEYIIGSTSGSSQKFLTPSTYPVMNVGQYFDISFFYYNSGGAYRVKREVYKNGVVQNLYFDSLTVIGIGVYRYSISQSIYLEDRIDLTIQSSAGVNYSETKTISVNSDCYVNAVNVSWLNYLGGFDYWTFKTNSDYGVDIEGTTQTSKSILPSWPKSFGEFADTIKMETSRTSRQTVTLRAERITADQVNDLFRIKTSPLVQIVNSIYDRRTIIPDSNSFTYWPQSEKLFDVEFTAAYTDTIPSQSL